MASDLSARNTVSTAAFQANRPDAWQIAWQAVTGDTLLVCALVGLGVLALLAAWFPQAPAGDFELAVYSRWLALVQKQFGAMYAPLHALGLFSISNTLLFRALIGLTGCALAARLVEEVEAIWKGYRLPAPPEGSLSVELGQPAEQAAARLRRRHWRVTKGSDYIVADRFPLAEIARLLALLGGLSMIAGMTLTATNGWHSRDILVGVGEAAPVGHASPYVLRLDALAENQSGQVTLLRESDPLTSRPVAPGRPLEAAGLSVHLSDVGPTIRASAMLSQTQPMGLVASAMAAPEAELLVRFAASEPERFIAAPEAGLLIHVSFSPAAQSFRVWCYRTHTGAVLFEGELPADGQIQVENVTVTLRPEKYARLAVTHDPGIWPTALGWLVGGLGLLGAWLWPPRRVWLYAESTAQSRGVGAGALWTPEALEDLFSRPAEEN